MQPRGSDRASSGTGGQTADFSMSHFPASARGWQLAPRPRCLLARKQLCTWFSLVSGYVANARVHFPTSGRRSEERDCLSCSRFGIDGKAARPRMRNPTLSVFVRGPFLRQSTCHREGHPGAERPGSQRELRPPHSPTWTGSQAGRLGSPKRAAAYLQTAQSSANKMCLLHH